MLEPPIPFESNSIPFSSSRFWNSICAWSLG